MSLALCSWMVNLLLSLDSLSRWKRRVFPLFCRADEDESQRRFVWRCYRGDASPLCLASTRNERIWTRKHTNSGWMEKRVKVRKDSADDPAGPRVPGRESLDLHHSSSGRYRYQTLAISNDDLPRRRWEESRSPRGWERQRRLLLRVSIVASSWGRHWLLIGRLSLICQHNSISLHLSLLATCSRMSE